MKYRAEALNIRKYHSSNDELYTAYSDIEKEITNYIKAFPGKSVYCNCSDPKKSNFAKFFIRNFESLQLKEFIVSGYNQNGYGVALKINTVDQPVASDAEYDEFVNKHVYNLSGNGSFDSDECIKMLNACDIIIDNPPFSRFRDYVDLLIQENKKFLIIGPMMACSYKHCAEYIVQGKFLCGVNKVTDFINPEGKTQKLGNVCWFTNLQSSVTRNFIELYKKYNPDEYPMYDGTDIINVNRLKDIPSDYMGIMGVPTSFITVYNPAQFKFINHTKPKINGKHLFERLLIQRRSSK